MALTVDVSVNELVRTRFALSPLSETVAALQQLAGQDRNPLHRRWLDLARTELTRAPLRLPLTWPLLANERPNWPEFLVPAPSGPGASIEDDLAALQRTGPSQVRASMRRVFGESLPPAAAELHADPVAGLRAVAAELRRTHERLIAPHWHRIRAVLEADVAHRSGLLGRQGVQELFADLHPELRWHQGRLELKGERWREDVKVNTGPGGLVLMPVVLGSSHVLVKKNTSTQTTVRYPARGVAALWSAGSRPAAPATVRLLGRVRADLLETLRSPATTTDVARMLEVTPSAVSQHLRVLRASGLVDRRRCGRRVLYTTTPLGRALADPTP